MLRYRGARLCVGGQEGRSRALACAFHNLVLASGGAAYTKVHLCQYLISHSTAGCTFSTTAAWLFTTQGTFGALGHGDEENRDAPVLVNPLWAAGIVMVS